MEEARRGWRAGGQREGKREEEERGEEGKREEEERGRRGCSRSPEAARKHLGRMDKNDGGRRRETSKWSELKSQRERQGKQTEKPQQQMLGALAVSISSILAGRAGEHKGSLYV